MGYNKMQRKLTAFVYSKRRLNQSAIKTYDHFTEVINILNACGGRDRKNRGRKPRRY